MIFLRKFLCFYFLPIGLFFCLPKLQGNPEDPPSCFWDPERRAWVASAPSNLFEGPKQELNENQISEVETSSGAKVSDDKLTFDDLSKKTDCSINMIHRYLTDKSNTYCFAVDQVQYEPTSFVLSGIGLFVASVNIKQKNPFVAKACLVLSVGSIAGALAKSLWDLGALSFNAEKAKE